MKRKKNLGKRIGFAVAAVAAFFLLAEIVCRIAFPGITGQLPFWKFDNPHLEMTETYEHDPVLFWRLKPDNPGYEINSDGYRGPLVPLEKASGEFRVICLGDSCTFGVGPIPIRAHETYPAVLQDLLQKAMPGRKVSVLNFGCPGYTSFQGKLLLSTKGITYRPDVVTAYFGMNDGFPAIGFPDGEQRPMVHPPNLPGANLLRECCLHEALVRVIYGARLSARQAKESTERVPVEDFHKNLDEMKALAAEQGFSIYFLDPPYLDEEGRIRRSDSYIHAPAINIYQAFADAHAEGLQPVFGPPDTIHPTIEGHTIVAETIFKRLVKKFSD